MRMQVYYVYVRLYNIPKTAGADSRGVFGVWRPLQSMYYSKVSTSINYFIGTMSDHSDLSDQVINVIK